MGKITLYSIDGVALLPFLFDIRVHVTSWVVGRGVGPQTERMRFNERRAVSCERPFDRRLGNLVDRQ